MVDKARGEGSRILPIYLTKLFIPTNHYNTANKTNQAVPKLPGRYDLQPSAAVYSRFNAGKRVTSTAVYNLGYIAGTTPNDTGCATYCRLSTILFSVYKRHSK